MSANIQTLSRANNNVFIKETVRELIAAIMTAILEANDGGHRSVEYELPVSFTASGISKSDAQLIVWTDVIEILTNPVNEGGKGFKNVKLKVGSGERVYLLVAWDNGLSDEERARRIAILKAHCEKQPCMPCVQPQPAPHYVGSVPRESPLASPRPASNLHTLNALNASPYPSYKKYESPIAQTLSPLSQWRNSHA